MIAADDEIMPQTKEAISHAQAAEVPIIFAINKIDKPNANPDKIKEQLASMDLLVEDWGGKFQCQEVSAKTGKGIDELLEKIIYGKRISVAVESTKYPGTLWHTNYDGVVGFINKTRKFRSGKSKDFMDDFVTKENCQICDGKRLKKEWWCFYDVGRRKGVSRTVVLWCPFFISSL